jgi:two-component system, NtrC family, sensor kinase
MRARIPLILTNGYLIVTPSSLFFFFLAAISLSAGCSSDSRANSGHNISLSFPLYSLLAGLFILFIVLSIFGLHLYRRQKKLHQKEKQLIQQASERSEQLYHINNQLYEEIAKHEDTAALLIETRNYLQSIINSMPSILIGINREGVITHWNTAAYNKTGIPYAQALGHHFQEVLDEPNIDVKSIIAAIDKKQPKKLEALQEGDGKNIRYKDITIYPLTCMDIESAVIRIDDVTMRVQLEYMIIQNEKMSSLGELAAGVAHEINNPLGTILQSIQNIQRRLSDNLPANKETAEKHHTNLHDINAYLEERKIFQFVDNIKAAGERAASIISNMLEFSSSNTRHHDPVQLIELINRSLDLAISSSSLSKEYDHIAFTIIRQLPEQCPVLYGSAGELQQVILNIINNAYQAYSDNFLHSTIENNTSLDKLEGELTIHVNLQINTRDAIITIADNGPGMDKWTQQHIFEPFFTTKEVSKGTGLGLSVSYFIITEHHHGSINVESELGKGTTFTIKLPLKQ